MYAHFVVNGDDFLAIQLSKELLWRKVFVFPKIGKHVPFS